MSASPEQHAVLLEGLGRRLVDGGIDDHPLVLSNRGHGHRDDVQMHNSPLASMVVRAERPTVLEKPPQPDLVFANPDPAGPLRDQARHGALALPHVPVNCSN